METSRARLRSDLFGPLRDLRASAAMAGRRRLDWTGMVPGQVKTNGRYDSLRHTLRALRGRNYSLFFVGQGLSLIGTWMQSVAISALVWKLTLQEMSLGLVGFAGQIFALLLAPLAGVFSDRWDRRRMLLATQSLAMLQAAALAALTLTGAIQLWHIIALAAFLGLINAVDMPTRQSFVVQIVHDRRDLPNAIALNSFIFNGARLVGPLIAAVVIPLIGSRFAFRYAGEGGCFALNSASYLAVLMALLAMRLGPWRRSPQRNVLHSLREGFTYSFGFPPIRAILLMLALINLVAMPYVTLLPAIADRVLLPGKATQAPLLCLGGYCILVKFENILGLLISSAGLGALLAALYLASRKSIVGLTRLIAAAAALLGAGMIAFSLSSVVLLSMGLLLVVGFGFMILMASCNTIIQTIVEEDKRGRVMSFYAMAFMGTAPFGALIAGWLGGRIGPQRTIALGGLAAILAGAAFASRLPALRRLTRPVYVKLGLLSESPPIPKAADDEDVENGPKPGNQTGEGPARRR